MCTFLSQLKKWISINLYETDNNTHLQFSLMTMLSLPDSLLTKFKDIWTIWHPREYHTVFFYITDILITIGLLLLMVRVTKFGILSYRVFFLLQDPLNGAAIYVTHDIYQNNNSSRVICCLQNLKRLKGCCTSSFAEEDAKWGQLSFILEHISWVALSSGQFKLYWSK